MKYIEKVILTLQGIILIIISLILALLPTANFNNYISENILFWIKNLSGEYILSMVGLIVFGGAIYLISLGVKRQKRESSQFIRLPNDAGDISISSKAIHGVVKKVIDESYKQVKNPIIGIGFKEDRIYVEVSGEISSDENILEIINKMQEEVKYKLEEITTINVEKVNIFIKDVAKNNRNLK